MSLEAPVRRSGLTLIELLVVISIIGLLGGLLLPAVQMARESSRRASCSSNLRNIGIAINSFDSTNRVLPIGSERLAGTLHAWSSKILPQLEQGVTYSQFDFKAPWDAVGRNQDASSTNVGIYCCPSATQSFRGKQDYGGVFGTTLLNLPLSSGPSDALGCGVMIVTSDAQPRAIRSSTIVDGLSQTIAVAESVDRDEMAAGRWACGLNCFTQAESLGENNKHGDMNSNHVSGVVTLFADGHVHFLSNNVDAFVLGGMCSRNGAEYFSQEE